MRADEAAWAPVVPGEVLLALRRGTYVLVKG
jgi:hypothetical protein